jgi:hypothetical protein
MNGTLSPAQQLWWVSFAQSVTLMAQAVGKKLNSSLSPPTFKDLYDSLFSIELRVESHEKFACIRPIDCARCPARPTLPLTQRSTADVFCEWYMCISRRIQKLADVGDDKIAPSPRLPRFPDSTRTEEVKRDSQEQIWANEAAILRNLRDRLAKVREDRRKSRLEKKKKKKEEDIK